MTFRVVLEALRKKYPRHVLCNLLSIKLGEHPHDTGKSGIWFTFGLPPSTPLRCLTAVFAQLQLESRCPFPAEASRMQSALSTARRLPALRCAEGRRSNLIPALSWSCIIQQHVNIIEGDWRYRMHYDENGKLMTQKHEAMRKIIERADVASGNRKIVLSVDLFDIQISLLAFVLRI